MKYRRARSAEQKKERVKDILSCAMTVFEEMGYDGLCFGEIAKRSNFTRTTIYKYFKTKEEVALLLTAHYSRNFLEELHNSLPEQGHYTTKELTDAVTHSMMKSLGMLELLAMPLCRSKNISLEIRTQYIKSTENFKSRIVTLFRNIMPTVREEECDLLFMHLLSSAIGLLPLLNTANGEESLEDKRIVFEQLFRDMAYREIYCVKMNVRYS